MGEKWFGESIKVNDLSKELEKLGGYSCYKFGYKMNLLVFCLLGKYIYVYIVSMVLSIICVILNFFLVGFFWFGVYFVEE